MPILRCVQSCKWFLVYVSEFCVTFADSIPWGRSIWVERVSPHDGWARIRGWHSGRWARLWERCKDFMDVY